jgi:hypothetical protein
MGRRRERRKPLAKTGGKSEALCREEGERRGIRGGFALSVASGTLSRPIKLCTAWIGQLKYSGSFPFTTAPLRC